MRLAALALRRPRATLAVWFLVTLALSLNALSFEDRLSPSTVDVPGSSSARAQEVAERTFGIEASIPILLEGPQQQVDRQGAALARTLRRDTGLRVLSPWDEDAQGIPELRPTRGAALILVLAKAQNTFAGETGQAIRTTVDTSVERPVRASVTGFSLVGGDLKDESLKAASDAALLAVPVLLLVLLLVFRSPIAAAIPALFGLAAVTSGFGLVALVATFTPITDVASSLTEMMGLALGVDYSLLLVSRFREELRHGSSPREAAAAAADSAGRTVVFAGVTLIAAMVVAMALSPGDFLLSAAASVALVAFLSVAGSFLAAPALLLLVGHRIDRWRIGGEPREGGGWARFADAVQRRPLLTAGPALAGLLLLSAPALGLTTGPPDVRTLPSDSRARIDTVRTAKVLGAGWTAPFEVYVSDDSGPITSPERLRAMASWQRRIAKLPGVRTVIGPGAIVEEEPRLLTADRRAARATADLRKSGRDARKLSRGLGQAERGVGDLRSGLRDARSAADRIAAGAGTGSGGAETLGAALRRARDGARELRTGLTQARAGSTRLTAALTDARKGTGALAAGLDQARPGARKLRDGAATLRDGLQQGRGQLQRLTDASRDAQTDVDELLKSLSTMTIGRTDPRYRQALERAGRLSAFFSGKDPRDGRQIDPDYPGLPASLTAAGGQIGRAVDGADALAGGARQLLDGLTKLRSGALKLDDGVGRITGGATDLENGLRRIERSTAQLPSGLGALAGATDRLADGIQRLQRGSDQLADALGQGATRSATLQDGLGTARDRTRRAAGRSDQSDEIARLRDRSPRLLDSGYFVLAALDGSSRGARTQAGFAVSLDGGGQAARITIVPDSGPNAARTRALNDRLQGEGDRLAAATGARVDVGGVAAQLTDYQRALGSTLPLLVVALSIITFLVLIPILRAIVLPALSVVLNLLTVGASFGVVALLFQGTDPPLGGPGYADIVSLIAMFVVVFGLSLDYQVFILARIREAWQETGDLHHAVTHAIDRTGRVVTGAAAIMAGVFISFALTDLTVVKQTGIGLATAVLIDATIVRMVLLPAALRLTGRATFWMPGWLDRALPTFDVEGTNRRSPAAG